jgi:hypothetical protein
MTRIEYVNMHDPLYSPSLSRVLSRPRALRGSWRIPGARGTTLTAIAITPASERDADTGLLAYLDLEINRLVRIDGVALRLTLAGALALSFPSRTSRRGARHALVRPTDRAARHAIERAIFAALGIPTDNATTSRTPR